MYTCSPQGEEVSLATLHQRDPALMAGADKGGNRAIFHALRDHKLMHPPQRRGYYQLTSLALDACRAEMG